MKVLAGGVEHKETRSTMSKEAGSTHRHVLAGSRIHEDVSLGVSCYTGNFTEIHVFRQFQEVCVRLKWYVRNLSENYPTE